MPSVPAESDALNVKKLEVLETVDGFHLESILIDFPPKTNEMVRIDNGSLTAILQGGDESKLYFRGSGAPLLAPEHQFAEADCADRAKVTQPGHPEVHAPARKRCRQTDHPP